MRKYSVFAHTEEKELLGKLDKDESPAPEQYQQIMKKLGARLGNSIVEHGGATQQYSIACTVEDADFLARGILQTILESAPQSKVAFSCFWNERTKFSNHSSIAPIIKEYREQCDLSDSVLIVVKSIIENACVVKTNLCAIIHETKPARIFIVAPVMYHTAKANLESEFDRDIADRFEYFYFAEDDQKDTNNNILPGIGGSVYERLGFEDGNQKNRYIPSIVKERRDMVA